MPIADISNLTESTLGRNAWGFFVGQNISRLLLLMPQGALLVSWRPEFVSVMSKITRRVIGQTTENFPILLVGIGLISTILWTSTIMALAVERVWSMLWWV